MAGYGGSEMGVVSGLTHNCTTAIFRQGPASENEKDDAVAYEYVA